MTPPETKHNALIALRFTPYNLKKLQWSRPRTRPTLPSSSSAGCGRWRRMSTRSAGAPSSSASAGDSSPSGCGFSVSSATSTGWRRSSVACAAIRVTPADCIIARPIGVRTGVDLLYTGAVRKVDAFAIRGALDAGEVVLVAHVGYSPTGEVFNLSWEDVAENVAIALKA